MGRKLDLSKLTDEEAKHVWEVIHRDFDLRKKEEERLEELKGKIEKESSKRELLSSQSHLNDTHCIHCLQPFRFLVNSKCQCLDCHLYTCKNCSLYNKKAQGWVCDPCRLSRVAKTGSLEWYYEHVRSRFRRFGSAKVMRSLYGRMARGQKTNPASRGTGQGLGDYQLHGNDRGNDRQEEEEPDDILDSAKAECYARTFAEFPGDEEDTSWKESMVAEADLAAMFHHILEEEGQRTTPPKHEFCTEVQLAANSRTKSLERTPKTSSSWNELQRSRYSADMDTSDEDLQEAPKFLTHQLHHTRRRSRASSQENINPAGSQMLELSKRMSAIERMLNRLEEKILVLPAEPPLPESQPDPSLEEKALKRKLEELASNISDKGASSEEEQRKKREEPKPEMSSSSDDLPTGATKMCVTDGKASGPEKRRPEDRGRHSGTTDSELSELEDRVASALAEVRHTESEVSDIESRIAALSAAGLTVKPVEKAKKKSSSQVFTLHLPRGAQNSVEDHSSDSAASPDFKVMSMPHVLRRKFASSLEISSNADSFARNAYYRGSLTQRNPNGKNRKADRIFAKPVMTHRS
ncbi:melanophilin isoform X5 [Paroedura picta]|uniref:melanophilin isoform X5 n=1 Tax=Paroedura picta TaxID=143630 RepID=UPI004056373C